MNLPFFSQIHRVTMAVHIRPVAYAIVDSLADSGDLSATDAAAIRARIPTYTPLSGTLEWRPELQDLGGCVNPF